jgi:hypothetical protein
MISNNRRGILLGILGLVVGGYFVNQLVDRFYIQPLAAETRQSELLTKRLRTNKKDLDTLLKKLPLRDKLEERALPANIEIASSVYQAWLLNLVTQLGVANPTVDSTSPIVDGEVTRLQFNVRGKANLKQFTNLLFEFFQAGHLHKITQVSLTPSGGSDRIDIQIGIEALALGRVKDRNELTTQNSDRLVFSSATDYNSIAKRNLFGDGAASQLISGTRLTAITVDRLGRSEVWLYVEPRKKTYFLYLNDKLDLDSVTITLKEIASDYVVLDVDGAIGKLELGKSLLQMQPISQAKP